MFAETCDTTWKRAWAQTTARGRPCLHSGTPTTNDGGTTCKTEECLSSYLSLYERIQSQADNLQRPVSLGRCRELMKRYVALTKRTKNAELSKHVKNKQPTCCSALSCLFTASRHLETCCLTSSRKCNAAIWLSVISFNPSGNKQSARKPTC